MLNVPIEGLIISAMTVPYGEHLYFTTHI